MKERGRRTVRWAAAVAGLAALAAGLLAARELHPRGERWARVERRDLVLGVEVEGELEAIDAAKLGPPALEDLWNFKIASLAPEGSEVMPGQVVLGFDTTELRQRLDQVATERESAQKTLEKASTDFEVKRRQEELRLAEAQARLRRLELKLDVPPELKSRRELEASRIDHRLARLEIEAIRGNLEQLDAQSTAELRALEESRDRAAARVTGLEAKIAAMAVRAPRAGTLIYLGNWRREKKKVGDSVWRGEKVVEVPDLGRMRASCTVDEAAVGRIEVGQRVRLRLDAYPDREIAGKVRRVRGTVQRKSWNDPQKIVRLDVELETTDAERMRPGMRLRGEVEISRIPGALVVPLEAVRMDAEGAGVVVGSWLGRRRVHPSFGQRNAELLEVTEGLEEGERVLLEGSEAAP